MLPLLYPIVHFKQFYINQTVKSLQTLQRNLTLKLHILSKLQNTNNSLLLSVYNKRVNNV